MKKGFVESNIWTILVLITVVVVALIKLLASAWLLFANIPTASSDYVPAASRASALASSLAHTLVEDRQFIEQATEIAATSVERSDSKNLQGFLAEFFALTTRRGSLTTTPVTLTIHNNTDGMVFFYSNVARKCGDDLSGFCVPELRLRTGPLGLRSVPYGCGKGRSEIGDEKYTIESKRCDGGICCVEDSPYGNDVLSCGTALRGVCDYPLVAGCFAGRREINDNDFCRNAGGSTTVCCLPVTQENLEEAGIRSKVEVPLIFNDTLGKVVLTVG